MRDIVVLPSNQPPDRFYVGGPKIARLRGEPPGGERQPEDWVASTTTLAGEHVLGLSVLPDGRRLIDAVEADPVAWLGVDHVERFGVDVRLLVKLLDAGQRLPVHAHPDGSFAYDHLGRAHGKAEAWFILDGGSVHLGLQKDISQADLLTLVRTQDSEGLLERLHEVEVSAGDVVFVPPGVLHAIGAGVFLVELQEPEDLSILLEWRDFQLDGERDGHLGLGFDLAVQAVERRARLGDELAAMARPAGFGSSVFPPEADPYFRLERLLIDGAATLEPGFGVLVVTEGSLTAGPGVCDLSRGATAVVPRGAGPVEVRGAAELLVCRPPRP